MRLAISTEEQGGEKVSMVKFYDENKRYGFIVDDDTGGDVFVHVSDIRRSGLGKLHADDVVSYSLGRHGRKANGSFPRQGRQSRGCRQSS